MSQHPSEPPFSTPWELGGLAGLNAETNSVPEDYGATTGSPGNLCCECEEELEEWMELTFSYQEGVRRFCSVACLLTWCADRVQEMEER